MVLGCGRSPLQCAPSKEDTAIRMRRITQNIVLSTEADEGCPQDRMTDAGNPMYSWRLPAAFTFAAIPDYPEPTVAWPDKQYNKWDTKIMRALWQVPGSKVTDGFTDFQALVGPGTVFSECGGKTTDASLIDDDCIILIETDANVHWIQPHDLDVRWLEEQKDLSIGEVLSGHFAGCCGVSFLDGQVWFLSDQMPVNAITKFATVAGAGEYDREVVLRKYCIASFTGIRYRRGE